MNELPDGPPVTVRNDQPIIHRLVQADLEQRLQVGIATYGQPLQAHNGRDALRDLYEELLDACCYIKQAMIERDDAPPPDTRNVATGTVTGPLVQARDISGGVRL